MILTFLLVTAKKVALLAEGVDRNNGYTGPQDPESMVALLAEGVDRNTYSAAG